MLTILISTVHVLVSFFLILVVLAQQGKGQDLASAFGGTGSQTAFGARGTATLLSKITAGAAVLFMVTSLSLSYLRPAVSGESVIPDTAVPASSEPGTESGEGASEGEDDASGADPAAEEPPADESSSGEEAEEGSEPPPEDPQ